MKNKFVLSIFTLICSICLLIPFGQAHANGSDLKSLDMKETANAFILHDEKVGMYYDIRENGYIDEVYEIKGGQVIRKVPIEEFIKLDVEDPESFIGNANDLTPMGINQITPNQLYPNPINYKYTESSNVETRLYGQRASIIQENRGPGDNTKTIGFSSSYTRQFNIGMDFSITEAVKLGVGYSYSTTRSVTGSDTMTIPAGYSGYWRFDPKVRKTQGTLRIIHGIVVSYEDVRGYYPVKYNNQLDGWLVSVKTPL